MSGWVIPPPSRSVSATTGCARRATELGHPLFYEPLGLGVRQGFLEVGVESGYGNLSMVMLEFEDTLTAARRRDRVPMQALAWLARRMPAPVT